MIPISHPLIGDEEKRAVLEVLDSGHLVQGEKVRQFEEAFAAICDAPYAVATSSGTTALHLALLAHGIGSEYYNGGPADEVITSPFSFIASANCVLYVGARPVFADIRPDTFTLDPEQVEAKITARTRAIIPVHLFGHPADMPALTDIARRHNLVLIEDACQAHGAQINGRPIGSAGTACFSFYATKNVTTAEGGVITTHDPAVLDRARLLRSHGMRVRYQHETLGYNFRMTDISAAIGLAQLPKLADFTERRIYNARFLSGCITRATPPVEAEGVRHVYHQYTVRVPGNGSTEGRDQAVQYLNAQGVGTGVFYPVPIHQQPVYLKLGYTDSFPVAEQASREVLSLPVHPGLSSSDLETIVAAVESL